MPEPRAKSGFQTAAQLLNSRRKSPDCDKTEDVAVEPEMAALLPPKRKSSFGLKRDPLTQTGIASFFNAKEGKEGGAAAAFKSALELSAENNQQGRDSIEI